MNMNFENENTIKFMEATLLKAVFEEENFKFLYVNDFLNMNIFYVEILKESNINNNDKVAVLHELGNYTPNVGNVNNEVSNDVNTSKTNEIEDILNEYNEDDLNKFEELDEDLY
jgi:cell fate regulator YaaT (PSP1 superfamily)